MDELLKMILAGVLSGSVISSIIGFFLYKRTARMAEDIKSEYARQMAVFQSSRAWREKSVSELLGPLYMQFDRTERAFKRWQGQNLYLEAKIIREGNLTIRDLLLSKSHLIPPDLLIDAGRLVEHYDRWLEEFEKIRNAENPELNTPFVFVGPQGFPFPTESEARFKDVFKKMWQELYG